MNEDNVTALFRATVAQARAEGNEGAYRNAARLLHDLYVEVDGLPHSKIKERLNAIRTECEVQANSAHSVARQLDRHMRAAGEELSK